MTDTNIVELIVPDFGGEADEVTIVSWLKSIGDPLVKDEAVLEVMTDKANMEVESPVDGEIVELLFEKDQVVKVGTAVAKIKIA